MSLPHPKPTRPTSPAALLFPRRRAARRVPPNVRPEPGFAPELVGTGVGIATGLVVAHGVAVALWGWRPVLGALWSAMSGQPL